MSRPDLDQYISRVGNLSTEIERFVPNGLRGGTDFRADLAGLLVVAIAATYEACVTETLVNYASRHNAAFGSYTESRYDKLSSKIALSDLHGYAKTFDPKINDRFKLLLNAKQTAINRRLGKDVRKSYEQILSWRHAYAHSGKKNTTVEEAMATHRIGQRVIFAFNKSFEPV